MGKVVKLEPKAGGKSTSKRRGRGIVARGVGQPAAGERRRQARPDKTALVLGGGGFTGGVYEIGALRALDLLAINTTVNQFDVYVGTSAGSFVAALAANGITPEEMMRVVNRQATSPFRDVNLDQLLRPNVGEFLASAVKFPFRAVNLARTIVAAVG